MTTSALQYKRAYVAAVWYEKPRKELKEFAPGRGVIAQVY